MREHRLYQADWLMRFYGFAAGELTTAAQPDLDLTVDPKMAWALRHRETFPVAVNRAPRETLLRVPGLGVRNVDRILSIRRWHGLTLADLMRLKVPLKKAMPFIETTDHHPARLGLDRDETLHRLVRPPKQLDLFDTAVAGRARAASVISGEL